MGLNVKIYNIISNGNYTIRYKSGNNPYPVETDSTFTLLGSYTPSTTEVTISGLTFDTQYWIKMTDNTTGRYIVQNIYTHDSKAFPCYDTICFSIDVTCEEQATPTPTPTYTQTVTPTRTPTRTPTLTPEMCAAPTLNSVTFVSGSTVSVSFVSGPNCVSTEIGYSVDNVNWVNNTGTCTSPRLIELSGSTGTYHIRIKKNCNGMSSSYVYEDFTFCSDSIRNTLSATNSYSAVGRQGMVYSSNNNKAYVLDSDGTTVKSFVPNSTTLTTEFTWSTTSYLLGHNPTENKLYSWQSGPSAIMAIRDLDTNTTTTTTITGITQGLGKIEYNSVLNKIYAFSQTVNFTTAQINIIDGVTNSLTNQITGLTLANVHATVYNPNNNKLYFAQGGKIYSCSGNTITLDGTTLPIISASLISLDVTNDVIYLVSSTTIYGIDAATNTTISMTPITGSSWNTFQLRSMIFNPDNGKLYVSRYSTSSDGFLGVLDPTTGEFTEIIGDGISQPLYVPTNTIYGINDTALYEICGSELVVVSPTPTPTPTPTITRTPTRTPTLTPTVGPLSMVGKTSADANDGLTACTNYSSVRGYYAAPGKTLSTLTYGDTIYLSYPSIVENGGGKWVALKTGGVGPSVAFQIASNGEILDVYTC